MACTADKVIAIARAELGYLEKETNSQLDSKTANAGDENYTKYARDLDKISNFYNGKKNGYAWCDMFVDWCFVQAFGVAKAKELLCQPDKSSGAGCQSSYNYYKRKGQIYSTPKVGDQIFFKNSNGSIIHTGLVYDVGENYVRTIEGNTSGASGVIANGGGVCQKRYPLPYSYIAGYGRPKYDNPSNNTNNTTESKVSKGVCNVEVKVLRKGSKGAEVKALQTLLIGYGYSCGAAGADGDFGNGTDTAVKKYQNAKGLNADGIVGANTWNKLLGIK